jgi:hypothetical protein
MTTVDLPASPFLQGAYAPVFEEIDAAVPVVR